MFYIVFTCSFLLALGAFKFLRESASQQLRFSVLFFGMAYGVTYACGATLLGFFPSLYQAFMQEQWVPIIADDIGPLYWILAFSPLIIPPICALAAERSLFHTFAKENSRPSLTIQPWMILLLFCPLALFALRGLFSSGFLSAGTFFLLLSASGDTDVMYGLRQDLFSSQSGHFFSVIYTILPFLSFVAIAEWGRVRRPSRKLLAVTTSVITFFLSVATLQGSVAAVYLIGLVLALINAHIVSFKKKNFVWGGLFLLLFLQLYHYIKFGDFGLWSSMSHYLLRAPVSLGYYLWAFPRTLPHSGLTLLGDFTGLFQAAPHHAFSVGSLVYAGDRNLLVSPAMPAPTHVSAYADAGLFGSTLYEILIGIFLALSAQLHRRSQDSALVFAFYIQSLLTLYYFTQVSFRDAMVGSYGWMWAVVTGGLLWGLRNFQGPEKLSRDRS